MYIYWKLSVLFVFYSVDTHVMFQDRGLILTVFKHLDLRTI